MKIGLPAGEQGLGFVFLMLRSHFRNTLPLVAAALIGAGIVSSPAGAAAETGCPLRVIPEHPSAPWQAAVDRARADLSSRSGDCSEVEVEVESDFATLKFTTNDGRRAVRVLHDASELQPTLDALLVTLPAPAPRASPPSEPVRSERPSANRVAEGTSASAPVHALVSGLAGGRLAGPGPSLGPSALLGAGIDLSRWELGITAQWTPVYAVLTDDATQPTTLAGISVGLAVGRRTPIGRNVALVTGMTVSAAAQHEGWHTTDPKTENALHDEEDRGQAIVGAYAAAVFPTTAKVRFRSSLSGDVDATHIGENGAPASGVPPLPWWALTLALGVESEVL